MQSLAQFAHYQSPLGRMILVANAEALTAAFFVGQKYSPPLGCDWREDAAGATLRDAIRELREYFAGERTRFEMPLAPTGTTFQREVWRALARVEYGETLSYAELAQRAGHAGKARAIGAANGRNPIAIMLPCHRIVGANGDLTGYAGGLDRKRALLALESRRLVLRAQGENRC